MNTTFRRISLVTIVSLLAACAHRAPAPRPTLLLPPDWNAAPSSAAAEEVTADWWSRLASQQLEQLIAQAHTANPDLRIASEHVRQAELQLRIAGASRFPALDLGLQSSWRRSAGGDSASASSRLSSLTLGTSYEVDLWGRVAAGVDSAQASLQASSHDAAAARLSIEAAVASSWFRLLALKERLALSQANRDLAQRVLRIVEARQRNGAAGSVDLALQKTALLGQSAAVLALENELRVTHNALAVLLGQAPSPPLPVHEKLDQLALPSLAAGLPSSLLTRRPDIAAAEARLQAAEANISAARAALLPAIQLSASGGLASTALLSLSNPATTLALSGALAQTIFDGGRKRAAVDVAASQRQQLLESYRKTVLLALQEVEDALGNIAAAAREEELQGQIHTQAALALQIASVRYREGADDLLSVLAAQRSLFQASAQLLALREARLNAIVDLYKALGGGWRADQTVR